MYVKTTNGNVDTYPYNVGQLRRDNPNTSFPKRIPDEMLAEWGVYPVTVATTVLSMLHATRFVLLKPSVTICHYVFQNVRTLEPVIACPMLEVLMRTTNAAPAHLAIIISLPQLVVWVSESLTTKIVAHDYICPH